MDMIVDFSASPPVAIPSRLTHEHVAKPSPVPGFRRVYVAPRDELFGSLHMCAVPHDDPRDQVVRRLDTASAEFGVMAGRKSSLAPAAP
jgi:hypothetical protein